ncbi:hypothetical protein ACMD2_24017 [Ananas comosus]|uniref:Uncharacterized protein n=1 Tax=Ananas comosus TaxID=4615 RepID=A0A199UXX3_ANACO|nr:hypothetical protein ACMD2_24017 [Ananas comosus]
MHMESLVERVRHVVRVVYYMLRKGLVSKRKVMLDLHLLLKRGKLAGKALANLMATMTFHHHHHGGAASSSSAAAAAASFSCASVDRTRDVEFSCTNTPSSSSSSSSSFFFFRVATNRNRRNRRNRRGDDDLRAYDAAAIAKAFEMLGEDDVAGADWMAATPSPALTWSGGAFWKSPALVAAGPVRQLRITDSPFPVTEEEGGDSGERVDVAAEEFIRRFYEQLRMQRSAAATPEYYWW